MRLTSTVVVVLHAFILYVECLVVPQYILEGPQPYVVVFNKGISSDTRESHIEGLDVDSFSLGDYHGYFGLLTHTQLNNLRNNPIIDFVENDHVGKFT